jgi:hypothetical protein
LPGKARGDADSMFLARPDSQVSIDRFSKFNSKGNGAAATVVENAVDPRSNKLAWDACSILITGKSPQ